MKKTTFNITLGSQIIFILFLACYVVQSYAATAKDQIHAQEFENGLKVIVKEDHRSPAAICQIWYKVGSSYEHSGITGISHALEHMMFKGTRNYSPGEIEKIVAAKGGYQNAFTSRDYTVYYEKISANELPTIFNLEADRMQNLVLEPEAFAKELKVIIEERLWRVDDQPAEVARERFFSTAFIANNYQQPVIGWMIDIEGLTVADLRNWYETWYRPNNAIIVVTGDVVAEEVFQQAKQAFAAIPKHGDFKSKPRGIVPSLGERRVELKLPAKVPHLFVGYNVPSVNTADEAWEPYALDLLAYILSGGDSSRLMKNLVRRDQISAGIYASYSAYDLHSTLFMLEGVPAKDKSLQELEVAISKQLKKLKTELVSVEELKRAKLQIAAAKIYSLDSMFAQSYEIGKLETSGYSWQDVDKYLAQVQQITPEQLQQAAKKFFVDKRLTVTSLHLI